MIHFTKVCFNRTRRFSEIESLPRIERCGNRHIRIACLVRSGIEIADHRTALELLLAGIPHDTCDIIYDAVGQVDPSPDVLL